eukprot:TRINITY_DN29271_c0_g1_i1.p1 TRINITY_DN29271_c0_g1~~TRINITY_DN29271_c0_g1_i1.p1  ORF type:complete len:199 (-),score=20.80 TRINITY_DN29271_c0_g1_i1:119-715(-)
MALRLIDLCDRSGRQWKEHVRKEEASGLARSSPFMSAALCHRSWYDGSSATPLSTPRLREGRAESRLGLPPDPAGHHDRHKRSSSARSGKQSSAADFASWRNCSRSRKIQLLRQHVPGFGDSHGIAPAPDGSLSIEERGRSARTPPMSIDHKYGRLFLEIDSDNTGTISLSEFKAAIRGCLGSGSPRKSALSPERRPT